MSWLPPRRLPWLLLIAISVFIADRLAKAWVVAHVPLGGAIPVIDHVLRISHWTNNGAAFSMWADSTSPRLVNRVLTGVNFCVAAGVLAGLIRLGNRISLMTVA
ncbi:MAG: signal peptidase II, partial [Terracidiphilus sp.]